MAQPSFTPRPAPKKGLPAIAWIGIGCVGVAFIGAVAFVVLGMLAAKKVKDVAHEFEANPAKAVAETIVRHNPDLEYISSDDSAGTITVRVKKTGEVVAFKYSDIQQGRWSVETSKGRFEVNAGESGGGVTVKTDEGEMRVGGAASAADVPAWVPIHPEATQVKGSFATRTAGHEAGAVAFTVPGNVEGVIAHYRSWMESNGFEVTTSALTGGTAGLIVGQNRAHGRTLNVTCTPGEGGGSQVAIQYASTGS